MGTRVPRLTPWATFCRCAPHLRGQGLITPPSTTAQTPSPVLPCFPAGTYPCGVTASPREPSALANRSAFTPPYSYSYSARRAVLVLDPLRGIPSSSQDLHWPEYEYQYEYENHIHAHTPAPQSLSPLPGLGIHGNPGPTADAVATLCRRSAPPGGKAPHAAPDHVQFFPASLRPCGKQSPSATPRPLPLYSYSYSARRAVLVLDPPHPSSLQP